MRSGIQRNEFIEIAGRRQSSSMTMFSRVLGLPVMRQRRQNFGAVMAPDAFVAFKPNLLRRIRRRRQASVPIPCEHKS